MKITIDTADKAQVQAAENYFEALGRIEYFQLQLANKGADHSPDDMEYFTENLEYWEGVASSKLPLLGVAE